MLVALGLAVTMLAGLTWWPEPASRPAASVATGARATPVPSSTPHLSVSKTPSASNPARTLPRVSCGVSTAREVRYRLAVDPGLPTTIREFAVAVRDILCDRRSWRASTKVRFVYDAGGSLLIGLRSVDATERRCKALVGLSVNRTYSCGTPREVVLNDARWEHGAPWGWSGVTYRQMLLGHEVGHALGLHHRSCPANGAKAPVMMQQSKSEKLNGKTCVRNPWPLADELARL